MPSLEFDLADEVVFQVGQDVQATETKYSSAFVEAVAKVASSHLEEERNNLDNWFSQFQVGLLQALSRLSDDPGALNGSDTLCLPLVSDPLMIGKERSLVDDCAGGDINGETSQTERTSFVHRFSPEADAARGREFHKQMISQVHQKKHVAEQAKQFLESISHIHSKIGPPKCYKDFIDGAFFNRLSTFTTIIIVLVVGLEADTDIRSHLKNEESPEWVLNLAFACNAAYVAEVALRILADGLVYFAGPDWNWNWFDLVLTTFSILDMCGVAQSLGFLRVLRVSKIMKAFRVIRVLKLVGELRLLLTSLIKSMAALVWSLILLLMITYLVAICFTQGAAVFLKEDSPSKSIKEELAYYYPNVPTAMYTLMACITGGQDWRPASDAMWKVGSIYGIAFLFFVTTTVMGLMNVITAIFVEHASNIVGIDREFAIMQHLNQVEEDVEEAMHLFRHLDSQSKGVLSIESLRDAIVQPRNAAYFATFNMDVTEAEELVRLFDTGETGEVTEHEFVLGCMTLRGEGQKADVRLASYNTAMHLSHIEQSLRDVHSTIQRLRPRPSQANGRKYSRISAGANVQDISLQEPARQESWSEPNQSRSVFHY